MRDGKHKVLSLDTHKYKTTFTSTTTIVLRFSSCFILITNNSDDDDAFRIARRVRHAHLPPRQTDMPKRSDYAGGRRQTRRRARRNFHHSKDPSLRAGTKVRPSGQCNPRSQVSARNQRSTLPTHSPQATRLRRASNSSRSTRSSRRATTTTSVSRRRVRS